MDEILFMRRKLMGKPFCITIFEGWNDAEEVKKRWELVKGVYPTIGTGYISNVEGEAHAYVTGNDITWLRLKGSEGISANAVVVETYLASCGLATWSHHAFICYTNDLRGQIELAFMNNWGEVWASYSYDGHTVDVVYCSNNRLGCYWVLNKIYFIRQHDKIVLKWVYDADNKYNRYHVCTFELTDKRFLQPFRRFEFWMLARSLFGTWDYPQIDATYIKFYKNPPHIY